MYIGNEVRQIRPGGDGAGSLPRLSQFATVYHLPILHPPPSGRGASAQNNCCGSRRINVLVMGGQSGAQSWHRNTGFKPRIYHERQHIVGLELAFGVFRFGNWSRTKVHA